MARRSAADVAIAVTSEVSDAVSGFDQVGRGALDMANQVDRASRDVDKAGDRLGSAADRADDLAGKTGKATGAMGALAGGLEAVGLDKYAGALQVTAIATDVASGAGDLFNLVITSTTVLTIKDRAAKVGHAAATVATTVATKAATIAQRALNLVLKANPIGAVIALVMLLVGAVILAYKRSETFRTIVDAAMRVARTAIGWVVDKVKQLWEGLQVMMDKARPILSTLQTVFTSVFDAIMVPIKAVKDAIESVVQAVKDVIDWIGKIKIPDLPDLNPFNGRTTSTGTRPPPPPLSGRTASPTIVVNVTGALDPDAVARQIERILAQRAYTLGRA